MVVTWLEGLCWKGCLASSGLHRSVGQRCQEYKQAMSHQNLRSGPEVLAFLCVPLAQVMLISAQSTEVFSLWFTGFLF